MAIGASDACEASYSEVRAGAASALSSLAFVLFALLFGVVSQRAGVFHAGWMVVGVVLLAGVLLVTTAMGWDAQGLDSSVI